MIQTYKRRFILKINKNINKIKIIKKKDLQIKKNFKQIKMNKQII